MYLLNLLPWCRLDREYKIGEILLRPYALGDELPEVGDETLRRYVEEIVSCYRDIDGRPFGHPSIAWWDGRSALSALTDEEAEILSETVTAACFGSLADRGIASAGGNYSNASRFVLYRYRFVRPSGFTSVVHRRRDGRTFDGRELAELRFTAPTETTTRSDIDATTPTKCLAGTTPRRRIIDHPNSRCK